MAQLKDLLVNGASRFIGNVMGHTVEGDIIPSADDTYYLGNSTHKWKIVGSLTGSATSISASGASAAKFWRGDNTWSDTISGGTLKITANSTTLTLGAQNTSWVHFTNSAGYKYYFDKQINAVDGFKVYNTNTSLTNNNLTFAQGGGWYMSDATWIRTVGSKSIYQNAGTLRTDGTFQIGGDGAHVNMTANSFKIGSTSSTTSQITLNGHVVINGSYNTSNDYSEGLRINRSSDGWSLLALGGTKDTTSGTGLGVWLIGAKATPADATTAAASITDSQFYISYNGAGSAAARIQGHNATGFSIRPRLAINANIDTTNHNYNLYVAGTSQFTDSINIIKAGECGVEVESTSSSNPNKIAFIVGGSGKGGIYSRRNSKWIVYSENDGTIVLNGNANSATKVAVTSTSLPSSGSNTYYLTYTSSTTTGNQDIKNSARTYIWENANSTYACFGSSGKAGAITLYSAGTKYGNINVMALNTANRNWTLPDASGTIALQEGISYYPTPAASSANKWVRIAELLTWNKPSASTSHWITLQITNSTYNRMLFDGVLKATVRFNQNGSSDGQLQWLRVNANDEWIINQSANHYCVFNPNDFVLVIANNNNTSITAEIWMKSPINYAGFEIKEIGEGGWSGSVAPGTYWKMDCATIQNDYPNEQTNDVYQSSIAPVIIGSRYGSFTTTGYLEGYAGTQCRLRLNMSAVGLTFTNNFIFQSATQGIPKGAFGTGQFWVLDTDGDEDDRWELEVGGGDLYFTRQAQGNNAVDAARISTNGIYGAVWNDYAEFRQADSVEPGRCVHETGNDTLTVTTKRLERGCEIISDTFGFAIGETDNCKTPIAASGRVLAYPYESRTEFAAHIGWPVCSGPNGTVSIMTEEEEEKYPSRIIGTISAVPDYEEWGTGKVKVNGRVWIRIR